MVDAAGAIYVIGGTNGTTYFNDVWVSTDGGARPDSRWVVGGYWGYSRVLAGYSGVPRGFVEYSRGGLGAPEGHPRGTRWAAMGYIGYSRGCVCVCVRVSWPVFLRARASLRVRASACERVCVAAAMVVRVRVL